MPHAILFLATVVVVALFGRCCFEAGVRRGYAAGVEDMVLVTPDLRAALMTVGRQRGDDERPDHNLRPAAAERDSIDDLLADSGVDGMTTYLRVEGLLAEVDRLRGDITAVTDRGAR